MPGTRPPNILFFFPDQHRGDWTGYRGTRGVRTPNLDGLAARGQVFRNALTPSPVCSPARACMAAVAPYDAQPVKHNQHDVDPANANLYQALRDTGYQVLACGKFDLLKGSMDWGESGLHGEGADAKLRLLGFTDGIDNAGKHDFVTAHGKERGEPFQAFLREHDLLEVHLEDYAKRSGKDRSNYANTAPTPLPEFAYGDNWIAGNGLKLLEETDGNAPWFLQVNFNGPHEPMDVTEAMQSRWRDTVLPLAIASSQYDPEKHRAIRANYAAMIENIDSHLGGYLDYLSNRGTLDDTLVIYASDHGDMLGDHGRWGKVVPYQASVHIPLVLAGAGIEAKADCDTWVDLVDLAATILHLAGADFPDRTGRVLTKGAAQAPRVVGLGSWRAIYDDSMKYVHNFDQETGRHLLGTFDSSPNAPGALYDLRDDPDELENLATAHPDIARRLRDALLAEVSRNADAATRV